MDPYLFCDRFDWSLFVAVYRLIDFLFLSLVLLYAVWTSINKWLLIVEWEFFLLLSCQHPGNFVPADDPDRQKKLRNSALKTHGAALNWIRTWKPTAKRWYYIWYRANILNIVVSWRNVVLHLVPWLTVYYIWCRDQDKGQSVQTIVPHLVPWPG